MIEFFPAFLIAILVYILTGSVQLAIISLLVIIILMIILKAVTRVRKKSIIVIGR